MTSELVTTMTDRRSVHPDEEWLVAYLTTGLSGQEQRGLDTHLLVCDDCVQTLSMMQRRLSMASDVSAPVPPSVWARAIDLTPTADSHAGSYHPAADIPHANLGPSAWLAWMRDRLAPLPRFSLIVPGAVATAALLVLVTQSTWMNPAPQQERSRSIEMHQMLRVTASEASVRGEPAIRTPALATLRRGAQVQILGTQGEWYHVELPDGRAGWMEGHAFE
jgi:hypothetical protein